MENTVHDAATTPSFVQNWTKPSILPPLKRYKIKCELKRPQLFLPYSTVFKGFTPPPGATHVIDPFLDDESLAFLSTFKLPLYEGSDTEDSDPFLSPPPYVGKWIVTVVPHGTATDEKGATIIKKYGEGDYYKCFLRSLLETSCAGAWLCLPIAFLVGFTSTATRLDMLSQYRIVALNQFYGSMLRTDLCSYVAVCFHRNLVAGTPTPLTSQEVPWSLNGETRLFPIRKEEDWVFCADLFSLQRREDIKVTRYLTHEVLTPGTQITNLTLYAIDGGGPESRIRMVVDSEKQYGSVSSRNLTTLCVKGIALSVKEQELVAEEWTLFLEHTRQERWGLFLSALDDQPAYSRKRISYRLACVFTEHVIYNLLADGRIVRTK